MEEATKAKTQMENLAAWQVSDEEVLRKNEQETIWVSGHNAEDTVTVYGALRAYLIILSQQPEQDLETIARVTRLMIEVKPKAVEASQEIARAAAKS